MCEKETERGSIEEKRNRDKEIHIEGEEGERESVCERKKDRETDIQSDSSVTVMVLVVAHLTQKVDDTRLSNSTGCREQQ